VGAGVCFSKSESVASRGGAAHPDATKWLAGGANGQPAVTGGTGLPATGRHNALPMGTLYLVRHGQASFGAADYDQLSELGARQCRRLGEHLRARGLQFEASLSGTLKRHVQSLDAIAEGLGGAPAPTRLPGLNEFDGEAIVRALYPEPPAPADPADSFRHHFRLLREGLEAWMAGRTAPAGMPTHADFVAGVAQALDHVRERHRGDVLVVSSGGPISTAVGLVLGVAGSSVIDLNLRMRNSAVTEFQITPRRLVLVSFNGIPHLEQGVGADWITHA
jgi:broad specificity phosphatase PhoE